MANIVTNLAEKISRKIFPIGFFDNFKKQLLISIPLILTSLSQIFSPVVSMVFCGLLGTVEFAGVSLANSIINMVVFVSAIGLATACDTLFPQIFGGDDRRMMGVILQKALLISVLSALGGGAVLMASCNLLAILTSEPEVSKIANNYILYFLPAILFINLTAVLVRYVQSQNIVYPIMIINAIVIGLNALFHQMFMFWFGLGLIGASIAINLTFFLLFVLVLLFIFLRKIHVGSWNGWSLECFLEWRIYLRLAIPGLFAVFIEWSNFEIGTLASASLDKVQLALLSVVNQVVLISYQVSFGIGTATNIRVGQFLGANMPNHAKNAAKVSYTLIAIEAITIVSFLFFGSEIVVKIFDRDPEVIEKGKQIFNFAAFIHLFDAVQGNSAGIIRAVGGQLASTIMYLIAFYLVGLPLGLCLMFLTSLKTTGFVIGVLSGLSILNVLQIIYLFRLDWIKIAQKAFDLSKRENDLTIDGKVYPKNQDIIEASVDTSNVNLENIDISSIKDLEKPEAMDIQDPVHKPKQQSKQNKTHSIKFYIIKRSIIFSIFVAIFIVSIFTRDIATNIQSSNSKSNFTTTTTTKSSL